MSRIVIAPVLICVSLLTACGPTEIGPGADRRQSQVVREEPPAPKVPVVLPPSILASKSYRCSDNGLLSVDFYSDGTSASMRVGEKGEAVRVKASKPGAAMSAEGGWSLKGGPKDDKVSVTTPSAKKPLSCHV